MKAADFIINKLNAFVKVFKNAKIRYDFDEKAQVHTIEVVPQYVYDSDEFENWENSIFDEFVDKYPTQNICFVSEDALVGIENELFSISGEHYVEEVYSIKEENDILVLKNAEKISFKSTDDIEVKTVNDTHNQIESNVNVTQTFTFNTIEVESFINNMYDYNLAA
jgi:hypothetical protein